MLDALTATPDRIPTLDPTPSPPAMRSLADRDEYGPITGRPGGLFTAASTVLLGECDDLGRCLADWVPEDHLL